MEISDAKSTEVTETPENIGKQMHESLKLRICGQWNYQVFASQCQVMNGNCQVSWTHKGQKSPQLKKIVRNASKQMDPQGEIY